MLGYTNTIFPMLSAAISCIAPAQPENGNISPVLSSYTYQQQVTFSCNTGYSIVGDATSTCVAVNMWSKAVPICEGMPIDRSKGKKLC